MESSDRNKLEAEYAFVLGELDRARSAGLSEQPRFPQRISLMPEKRRNITE
jgi:hypothetical protein